MPKIVSEFNETRALIREIFTRPFVRPINTMISLSKPDAKPRRFAAGIPVHQ